METVPTAADQSTVPVSKLVESATGQNGQNGQNGQTGQTEQTVKKHYNWADETDETDESAVQSNNQPNKIRCGYMEANILICSVTPGYWSNGVQKRFCDEHALKLGKNLDEIPRKKVTILQNTERATDISFAVERSHSNRCKQRIDGRYCNEPTFRFGFCQAHFIPRGRAPTDRTGNSTEKGRIVERPPRTSESPARNRGANLEPTSTISEYCGYTDTILYLNGINRRMMCIEPRSAEGMCPIHSSVIIGKKAERERKSHNK